ncbi:MAG: hypothetical protein J6Z34_02700 [Clostridia bacterium]|nr:hypothetical protein [Clostridia bacterium]
MKKIILAMLCCCLILFGSFGAACALFEKNEPEKQTEASIDFTEKDWVNQKGEWKFKDKILTQTAEGNANRILLNKVEDQNYLEVSVDVKFSSSSIEGGIEFRADYVFDNTQKLAFVINKETNVAGVYYLSAARSVADRKPFTVKTEKWYNLRVKLSGVNAEFYIDGTLWQTRNDISLKKNSPYIALITNDGGVSFRNFSYDTKADESYSWQELVAAANVEKSGYDRFNSSKFEYPYIGLGRTTMLVNPYGFIDREANRPGQTSYVYKNDPALIYDYWWDDTIKVTPFTFGGGYTVNGRVYDGKVTDDGKTAYSQLIDVSTGKLTTSLTLDVNGKYVNSVRETVVDKNGVVAYKITNDATYDFVFDVETEKGFGKGVYTAIDGGFVIESVLRKDAQNKGYLAIRAVSENGFTVDAENGTITFKATQKPIYIYLSPSSTLDEGTGAKAAATERAKAADFNTAVAEGEEIYGDIYSRSQISIPDKGMGVWYVRSLFYNVVSMYGARVPVGCYGSNPDGFFGNVCFEFDIMFQQLAMLYLNQTELSGSTVDWIKNIKEKANEFAANGYTDRYGNTLPELIDNGYLFAWLMGYDGSPAHGEEVGHERGWMSLFSGANVALAVLKQAEYTDGDLAEAKDILAGQLRVLLSFFEYSEDHDWYWHKGVWTGSGNNYSKGDGNQNAAAVYSIYTLRKIYEKEPTLFTAEEVSELEGWEAMLDKMWPAAYYNTWHHIGVGGDFIPTSMSLTDSVDSFAGIFPMILAWYNIYDYDLDEVPLTAVGYESSFNYFFNSCWSAFIAARAGQAELAEDIAKYVLNPICLYDDAYFCENAADGEDYKRAPETGAHGAYLMAVSAMMFDGESEEVIKIFPAITEEWQNAGVSFGKYLATGNIEVSAEFTDEKTTVKLVNKSDVQVTRKVLVRVAKGSGAAVYNGTEYALKGGCFVEIPVTLSAGETFEAEVRGIEKDVEISSFHAILPMDGSNQIRLENVIFEWSRSDTAAGYELVISENADLSAPLYDIDMGQRTFLYPTVSRDRIDLEEGKTYYWAAYGVNGKNRKIMDDGICSFAVRVVSFNRFGYTFENKGDVALTENGLKLSAPAGANDTSNVVLVAPGATQYTVDLEIEFEPTKNHQQSGILLYVTEADYLKLSRSYTNNANVIDMKSSSGSFYASVPDRFTESTVYFRLVVTQGVIAGYFGVDGTNYQKLGEMPNEYNGKNVFVGAFASVWSSVKGTVSYVNNFAIDTENYEITDGVTVVDETLFGLAGRTFKKYGDISVSGESLGFAGSGNEVEITGVKVSLEGNYEVTAKYVYDGTAGMLIKNGDAYQFIRVTGNNYESYGNIEGAGGIGSTAMGEANGNIWLKVAKDGGLFETYYSLDGEEFIKAYSYESSAFAAFGSYDAYIYATSGSVTVSEVSVREIIHGDPDPIGSVLKPVSAVWSDDANTEIAGGYITATATAGVWEDQAAQASIVLNGHYEVFSKVALNKGIAGIKISADGNYQFIRIGNGKYASYGNIESAGGVGDTPVDTDGKTIALKILRKAALFETYYSLDGGENWTKVYGFESENFADLTEYTVSLYAIQGATAVFYGTYVREFCKSYAAAYEPEYAYTEGASGTDGTFSVTSSAGVWEDGASAVKFDTEGAFVVTAKASYSNGIAGIMIKTDDGAYQFIRASQTHYASYGNIEGAGGIGDTAYSGNEGVVWYRIHKNGSLFETYYSLDGSAFTKVYGYESEAFSDVTACTVYLYGIQGAAVTFDSVTVEKYVYQTVGITDTTPAPELPDDTDPEEPIEKGVWKATGETTYENGVATVQNGGSEDSENYLGITLEGDYTVTAKVSGIHYIGMQLRTNTGYMFIRLNVAGKNYCSYGNIEGAGGIGDTAFEPTDNMYLRIVKNGTLFETYYSLDGGVTYNKVYSYTSDKFAFTEYEVRLYSIGQPATFSDISVEKA